jgi:hypothetical protein
MQYAMIEIKQQKLLISANEMQSLNLFRNSIADLPYLNEAEHPYHICYGCYMPQPNTDEVKALEDFKAVQDHWIGYVDQDKCYSIAFHEAEALESLHRGKRFSFPFAALIQADESVIKKIGDQASVQAVTGFLRYLDQMTPATNILNRPGIIALKGIERRLKQVIPSDWRRHIDRDRARRTAVSIK